ncbi:MAG TPA: hypothetical protein VIZ20_03475 [Streptosporangiaceae bacterium]
MTVQLAKASGRKPGARVIGGAGYVAPIAASAQLILAAAVSG